MLLLPFQLHLLRMPQLLLPKTSPLTLYQLNPSLKMLQLLQPRRPRGLPPLALSSASPSHSREALRTMAPSLRPPSPRALPGRYDGTTGRRDDGTTGRRDGVAVAPPPRRPGVPAYRRPVVPSPRCPGVPASHRPVVPSPRRPVASSRPLSSSFFFSSPSVSPWDLTADAFVPDVIRFSPHSVTCVQFSTVK